MPIFLPMHDTDEGLLSGSSAPDEQVTAFLRRYLPDFYFVNTPLSRMRRHLEVLHALPQAPLGVLVNFHKSPGASFSELVLCARDEEQPGLLSQVAGTLAALGVAVHTAWIHSLADPFGEGGTVVLDTLLISEHLLGRPRALSPKNQKQISQALTRVLNHEQSAEELLQRAGRRRQKAARAPIDVLDLSVEPSGDYTLVKLHAQHSKGALSRITHSLAAMRISVAHAQINTFERSVDDVFFVTNPQGNPYNQSEMTKLAEQLREELSRCL